MRLDDCEIVVEVVNMHTTVKVYEVLMQGFIVDDICVW